MHFNESTAFCYCMLSLKQKNHESCIYFGKAFSLLKVVCKSFIKSNVFFVYCSGCLIKVARDKKVINMILTTEYSTIVYRVSLAKDTDYFLLGLTVRVIQNFSFNISFLVLRTTWITESSLVFCLTPICNHLTLTNRHRK